MNKRILTKRHLIRILPDKVSKYEIKILRTGNHKHRGKVRSAPGIGGCKNRLVAQFPAVLSEGRGNPLGPCQFLRVVMFERINQLVRKVRGDPFEARTNMRMANALRADPLSVSSVRSLIIFMSSVQTFVYCSSV